MDRKEALRLLMKGTAAERKQRLDHPLVRYNDLGQIVCKLCNTVVKSEAAWNTHLVSKSHKETVARLKSKAAAQKTQAAQGAPPQPGNVRKASDLPSDFFDGPKSKQPKTGVPVKPAPVVQTPSTAQLPPKPTTALPPGFFDDQTRAAVDSQDGGADVPKARATPADKPVDPHAKKDTGQKGVLPKGFFDDKEKDHKARGEEAPKLDINEEFKQFQRSVQVDIAEVDVRQEEEEAEAADEREERENIQQKSFLQHIQDLKRQKEERAKEKLSTSAVAKHANGDAENEESSESDDDDEDFSLHWRAKRV